MCSDDTTGYPVDEISARLARRLVDSQFPHWSSLALTPVARQGVDNRTFRLGEELSIRLPTGDRYAEQVAKEQHWLPRLAPRLPLPIPQPVAMGRPAFHYPYPWSVYRWLDGATAEEAVTDWGPIGYALGHFLRALHHIDPGDGPEPGPHNFFRGAPVSVYAEETGAAIDELGGEIDVAGAQAVWAVAIGSTRAGEPCWFHGDMAADNLLTRRGRLTAVIDFGLCGVGDPACDTVLAWTHLDAGSRTIFRRALDIDAATWARGRGWALWKALISLRSHLEADDPHAAAVVRAIINGVIADHDADR
ncbi:phosphotransferase enzyme family protein [Mycobacterium kansasii 732]|uniref:Aminoglycoside phosphotransferase domain-containing protein n=1 Tax=Mycobacterium pseudokansasii TaxID=2341080 RepID=A0A498QRY5_9MYCO|nr:aminoglycoside phosphotransferase family protein [Mycobacterium pseudokansasii]EUA06504.1 phosphotransferase enzyme family protein [Mycobacterium kansasii 732]KZS69299.1 hypothetical protein A4G27_00930 [Mycobacterium kansasii]VAZ95894.1 hypothetical protein LAUMK35_03151 [Mycobacterium pseudokansasii]VAZ97258.1 hypothetical protein LAUMK21_03150 [Mycobacterium pseudokansasii]VBA51361.1 hypothetical protein LAUMK142_03056 [Mycobacterium pseudokansasii]